MTRLRRRRGFAAVAAACVLTMSAVVWSGSRPAVAEPTKSPTPSESASADPKPKSSPAPSDSATAETSPPASDEGQPGGDAPSPDPSPSSDESDATNRPDEPGQDAPGQDKPGQDKPGEGESGEAEPTDKGRDGVKFGWGENRKAAASDASAGQQVKADRSAEELASALVGHGVKISNARFTGHQAAAGTFDGFKKGVGIGSGVALSTGSVVDAGSATSALLGPNDGTSNTQLGTAGDSQLSKIVGDQTHDAAVLEFDFTAAGSEIEFSYVFGSEEYPEYVGDDYNDVFALSVNGTNCALIPGTDEAVAINNVNADKNAKYFRDNADGAFDTQMDGMTTELTCTAKVESGQTNHIRLAVADTVDDYFDSSVLIEANSVQVPTPPKAEDQKYSIYNVQTADIELTGTDVNGDQLSFGVDKQPKHGTLSGDVPQLTYTPDEGYVGTDTFTYRANDGEFDSKPATVTIDVKENTAPTATDDAYETKFMTELSVDAPGVLGNDKDPDDDQELTVVEPSDPEHGTVKVADDGALVYTPDKDYSGQDSFSYAVTDGLVTSDPATVTIDVLGNDPAVGEDDNFTTGYQTALLINAPGVLKNDSDPNGDDIFAVKVVQPKNGAVTLTKSGKLTYIPQDGFSGKDRFSYRVSDGHQLSDPITVTVTVQDPPGSSDDGSDLGDTGSNVPLILIIVAAAALVAGAAALLIGRRLRK